MSLQIASIAQNCKALRLPAVGAQFASLAEEAGQRNHSHLHYLEALLQAEMEDRERRSIELRMKEAHLPRIKTLEEFDLPSRRTSLPPASAPCRRRLSRTGRPVLLVGDPAPARVILPLAFAIAGLPSTPAGCALTTAAALVNQLVEAQREQSLSRMLARWSA